jgi:shikimate kinase
MTNPRRIQNVALIGFMGTGKSTIGRLIAEELNFKFIDTDRLIELKTGKTISEIFSANGEKVFREFERAVVDELTELKQTVIACGGGLAANEQNLASLKSHAFVICLWASPEKIWERVRHQTRRPLLQDKEPLEKIRTLLAAREPYYRQADALVNTEMRSTKEVAQQVIHQFQFAHRADQ